jgi:hypothetical protein
MPSAADKSNVSDLNQTTSAGFTTSDNRSDHSRPNETTKTLIPSSSPRILSDKLIIPASQNQQLNCITSGDATHSQNGAFSARLEGAVNYTAHVFSTSDSKNSDFDLKQMPKCIQLIIQQTSLDSTYISQTLIRNMSKYISQIEPSTQNLDKTKPYAEILSSILALDINTSYLEYFGSRAQNISTLFLKTREYDKAEEALQEYESYLKQLEVVVQAINDINTSLDLQNLSAILESPWVKCILAFGKWENELAKARNKHREVLDMFVKVKVLEVFRRYVDPVVYFVILEVGLVWNGILLLIFARHRQLWTSANAMIFNLAVGDIVTIIVNLPVFYFAHYHLHYFQMNEYVCKFYITLRPLFVAVSALSVVALSILRYVASGTSFNVTSRHCSALSKRSRIATYVLIVWALAIGLALPYSFGLQFTAGNCFMYGDGYTAKMVALSEFMFYCVALPCIMVGFTVLTAKRLKESTRSLPYAMRHNGQDLVRKRSANVLIALIAVFLISYIPQHLWRVLYRWLSLDIWQVQYQCIDKVTYYFLFANCCFNPISLYGVSRRFRKLFNYYFLYFYDHH